MKKNMIVGIAVAVVMLSFGALSVSAAGSAPNVVTCAGKHADQQFVQETAGLASAIRAKEVELQAENAYREWDGYHQGIDVRKINALELELRELKDRIKTIAQKHGFTACACG